MINKTRGCEELAGPGQAHARADAYDKRKGFEMTATVGSSEIPGRPENGFAYATDFSHRPEWEGTVISVRAERNAPLAVRRRAVVTRRVGRRPLTAREEITELNPVRERVAA
jgi:hypothetical protein